MFETNSSVMIADYKYCTLKFAGLSLDADNLEFHLHIQYTKLKYIKVTREIKLTYCQSGKRKSSVYFSGFRHKKVKETELPS